MVEYIVRGISAYCIFYIILGTYENLETYVSFT